MLSRRALLSVLMFVSLVGALQSVALAQAPPGNGRVAVSQVTTAASTNMAGYYFVELYHETGQLVINADGQVSYQTVWDEHYQGLTSVGALEMGPTTYYIHLKDFRNVTEGRNYSWIVWPTKPNANGVRVKDMSNGTISTGQTMAVAQ